MLQNDFNSSCNKKPYTQANNLLLSGMPLEFTADGPLSDYRRVCLGNVITGGPVEAHRWPSVDCHQMFADVDIDGPPAGH